MAVKRRSALKKKIGLRNRIVRVRDVTRKGGAFLDIKITEARNASRKMIKREGLTMQRMVQFTVFFTVFMLVYLLLNYYVFARLGGLFGLPRALVFYLAVICTASFPLAQMIERYLANRFSRILYTVTVTWMGVLFFLFSALIAYEILTLFFQLPQRGTGIFILVFVALLTLGALVNSLFVTVKTVVLPLKGLQRATRFVQLSDLHIGTIRDGAYLERVVRMTNKLRPDAVLITGDLVDGSAPLRPGMFDALNRLEAPAFFVTGNHEVYEGVEDVVATLATTKLVLLRDAKTRIHGIQLVGIDYSYDKERFAKTLPALDLHNGVPTILLSHAPEGMEQAAAAGVSLQLAGHTHNGQVWPFNLLVKLVFRRIKGLYDVQGMKLYVSPGTGTWGPPMRLGSRNEITLLDLKPA